MRNLYAVNTGIKHGINGMLVLFEVYRYIGQFIFLHILTVYR